MTDSTLTRFNEWRAQWETVPISGVSQSYIENSEKWHAALKEYADEMHNYYDAD